MIIYNVIFSAYFVIVGLSWIYLFILRAQKKLTTALLIAWMTSGANPIGMLLFFCFRHKFVKQSDSE